MEILYTNCAGLDVHKKTVKVCLLTHTSNGQSHKEFRTYFTTTEELLKLGDWLKEQGCTHVAFEATGVYWKPVFNLLEGSFEVLVVNAQHIKAVPGRKTDVKDAEWIADLLQHGLLKASFIPSGPQRELRDLTRYRVRLTQEKAREVNRVQKTLEDTNLKLGDVVSDIMGKASRMILQAIADGETDPGRLAALAVGRVQCDSRAIRSGIERPCHGSSSFSALGAFDPDSSSGASYRASHRRNYAAFHSTSPPEERTSSQKEARGDARNAASDSASPQESAILSTSRFELVRSRRLAL